MTTTHITFSTHADLTRTVADWIGSEATPALVEHVAGRISVAAHTVGLTYGDDWSDLIERLTEPESVWLELLDSCWQEAQAEQAEEARR